MPASLLHRLLTGADPFEGDYEADQLAAIMQPGNRFGLPKPLWRIIGHCLEKDAADRFGSMGDLIFALEGVG